MKPILLDSSAWIEFFADGPLADSVGVHLKNPNNLIAPAIVIYEVYKKLKIAKGEELALEAIAQLAKAKPAPLTETIALLAADISIARKLAMADAIVLATAQTFEARIVTLDSDFKNIPEALVLSGKR